MRTAQLVLLTVAFCCQTLSGLAQRSLEQRRPQKKRLREMSLEELLGVTVSVASRTEETIATTPSSVTVFTRQQILDMGVTSIEQLLNFVPGFQATRESVIGIGQIVAARGQSTPQASYNILFLLDGERLNSDLSGGALEFGRLFATGNVKQVEVIRGPGSALYGTGAFSGVVNIVTQRGLNEAFVSRGNLNGQATYIDISKEVGSSELTLFASHFSDDGQRYGSRYTNRLNPNISSVTDPQRGNDVQFSYGWREKLELKMRYMDRNQDGFISLITRAFPTDRTGQQQRAVTIKYTPWRSENGDVKISAGWVENYDIWLNQLIADSTTYLEQTENKEREWRFGLNIQRRLFQKHRFTLGLEWRRPDLLKGKIFNNLADPTGELTFAGTSATEGHRRILGLYGQYQYALSKNLQLTLGLRHDDYSDFGGSTSPRGALVYHSGFDATFKVIYGQAFRAPSRRQAHSTIVGNPNLKPETVKTFELVWLQKFAHAHTGITFFHSDYAKKITTVLRPQSAPTGGPRIFMNTTDSRSTGFELEASIEAGEFSFQSTFTHFLDTEASPRSIAEQTFSTIVNYHHNHLNLNASGYYHSEMEQNAAIPGVGATTITLPDHFVLNAAVRYELQDRIVLVARTENILDDEFATPTRTAVLNEGLPNRGRTAAVGVEVLFWSER